MIGYGHDIHDVVNAVCAAGVLIVLFALPFVYILGVK